MSVVWRNSSGLHKAPTLTQLYSWNIDCEPGFLVQLYPDYSREGVGSGISETEDKSGKVGSLEGFTVLLYLVSSIVSILEQGKILTTTCIFYVFNVVPRVS